MSSSPAVITPTQLGELVAKANQKNLEVDDISVATDALALLTLSDAEVKGQQGLSQKFTGPQKALFERSVTYVTRRAVLSTSGLNAGHGLANDIATGVSASLFQEMHDLKYVRNQLPHYDTRRLLDKILADTRIPDAMNDARFNDLNFNHAPGSGEQKRSTSLGIQSTELANLSGKLTVALGLPPDFKFEDGKPGGEYPSDANIWNYLATKSTNESARYIHSYDAAFNQYHGADDFVRICAAFVWLKYINTLASAKAPGKDVQESKLEPYAITVLSNALDLPTNEWVTELNTTKLNFVYDFAATVNEIKTVYDDKQAEVKDLNAFAAQFRDLQDICKQIISNRDPKRSRLVSFDTAATKGETNLLLGLARCYKLCLTIAPQLCESIKKTWRFEMDAFSARILADSSVSGKLPSIMNWLRDSIVADLDDDKKLIEQARKWSDSHFTSEAYLLAVCLIMESPFSTAAVSEYKKKAFKKAIQNITVPLIRSYYYMANSTPS